MRPILTYPADVLTRPTQPVGPITPDIHELVTTMVASMRQAKGVGLAAPQIGQSLRLAVVEYAPTDPSEQVHAFPLMVLINPKLISASRETVTEPEGCLSLPGIEVDVPRAIRIKVRATMLDGTTRQFRASGFQARVVQHELDHLAGRLITHYAKHPDKLLAEYQHRQGSAHPTTL